MIEYKIDYKNPDPNIIKKAAEAIKNGKIVIFPCDTSYGLAASPTNENAIERLYQIKKDTKKKPISVIVKDKQMAQKYAIFTKQAEEYFDKYLPGLTTLIYPAKRNDFLPNQNPSFRIPNTPITDMLSEFTEFPYTATSANITAHKPAHTVTEIYDYFCQNRPQPDIFLNAGDIELSEPSTVIDLTTDKPKIIRKGPVNLEK